MDSTKHLRKIRSFVRREGRMTSAQQRALTALMPRYGLAPDHKVFDLETIFGRIAANQLEIGFGNGDSLMAMAQAHPEVNYLGIEVHRPGVGNLLLQIEKHAIENIRVICADAVEVLENNIVDGCLDAIYIFFPDPWHKTRHHKRRLVQVGFVELLKRKLKNDGLLHMATDWENYAKVMLSVMQQVGGFRNLSADGKFCERPDYRPLTRFEQRGIRLGHKVWDLLFRKI